MRIKQRKRVKSPASKITLVILYHSLLFSFIFNENINIKDKINVNFFFIKTSFQIFKRGVENPSLDIGSDINYRLFEVLKIRLIMRRPSDANPAARITTSIAFPVIAVSIVSPSPTTSEIADVIAVIFFTSI